MFVFEFWKKPVAFGIERTDGMFEALEGTHFRVDRKGYLHVYNRFVHVALFKADEWVYVERGLTAEQIGQRG